MMMIPYCIEEARGTLVGSETLHSLSIHNIIFIVQQCKETVQLFIRFKVNCWLRQYIILDSHHFTITTYQATRVQMYRDYVYSLNPLASDSHGKWHSTATASLVAVSISLCFRHLPTNRKHFANNHPRSQQQISIKRTIYSNRTDLCQYG